MKVFILLGLLACAAAYKPKPARYHHHYYGDVINNHQGEVDPEYGVEEPLTHHEETDRYTTHHTKTDKVYTFGFGHESGAYGFLDTDGTYKGLWVDILVETCKAAKKNCTWIVDRYENCWTQDEHYEYPGTALLAHYYDGCFGYVPTNVRRNTFNFTKFINPTSDLVILINEKIFKGDQHDLTGRTGGIFKVFSQVPDCLAKQTEFKGVTPGAHTLKHYPTLYQLIHALKKGEVEFVVVARDIVNVEREGLKMVTPALTCGESTGYSVMTQYHSPLTGWFNKYFLKIRENGTYDRLCREATEKYSEHGSVNCY